MKEREEVDREDGGDGGEAMVINKKAGAGDWKDLGALLCDMTCSWSDSHLWHGSVDGVRREAEAGAGEGSTWGCICPAFPGASEWMDVVGVRCMRCGVWFWMLT